MSKDIGIFADPARRKDGQKIHNQSDYIPTIASVEHLNTKIKSKLTLIKVGTTVERNDNLAFISVDGELVEGLYGIKMCAIMINTTDNNNFTSDIVQNQNSTPPKCLHSSSEILNGYLVEPDAAIIRSGLIASFAKLISAKMFDKSIAYLYIDSLNTFNHLKLSNNCYKVYKIIDYTKLKQKNIVDLLIKHQCKLSAVKKRGSDINPHILMSEINKKLLKSYQKKYSLKENATLIVTRLNGKHIALITQTQ